MSDYANYGLGPDTVSYLSKEVVICGYTNFNSVDFRGNIKISNPTVAPGLIVSIWFGNVTMRTIGTGSIEIDFPAETRRYYSEFYDFPLYYGGGSQNSYIQADDNSTIKITNSGVYTSTVSGGQVNITNAVLQDSTISGGITLTNILGNNCNINNGIFTDVRCYEPWPYGLIP